LVTINPIESALLMLRLLCVVDPYTGQDSSHRKEWILDRTCELAGLFDIEVCGYSVMNNHPNQSNWLETARGFGELFKQAAGRSSSLVDAAARCSKRWFQGKEAARTALL
jgi:hypothetical protein